MNDNNTIVVENVSKRFRLRTMGERSLKSTMLDLAGMRSGQEQEFWALKDVSFSVRKGETLGIIGSNGAGKSTLLALLTGTKTATEGSIQTSGVVSSLLELGAGFHPDLTGRENVFLCGAVMGLRRKQMEDRFEAIVDFAGIHEFIDHPVKHYSSGMYVRLGFAIAVEVDPDILLIDEVLAVGDASFQRKCIAKMEEFRAKGKTMLIISHDLRTIQSISDRILLLDGGRVVGLGDPEGVVERYESISRQRDAEGLQREWGTGEVKITGAEFFNANGQACDKFEWGKSMEIRISYKACHPIERPVFGFAISDKEGRLIYGNNTQIENIEIPLIEGDGSVRLCIDNLAMATGTYLFSFSVHSTDHKINYHRMDNRFPVAVESDKQFEGMCYMPCSWIVV